MCCSLCTLEGVSCITALMGRRGVAEYIECRNKKKGDLLLSWPLYNIVHLFNINIACCDFYFVEISQAFISV